MKFDINFEKRDFCVEKKYIISIVAFFFLLKLIKFKGTYVNFSLILFSFLKGNL